MHPNASRALALAAIAALTPAASADIFQDDFESAPVGSFPGDPWHDIFERAVDRPVPAPTMTIIETTDAHGNATRAIQSSQTSGTNGAFVPIEHANKHTVSMDVRIDRAPAPNQGWPMAVGFIQDSGVGSGDVNANPQALIYGWNNRRWWFFISQGQDRPAVNVMLGGPQYQIGVWYRFTITADTELGVFEATVADAATGDVLNERTITHTSWDPARGMFDAITMFDGESATATTVGQATLDNVVYTPAPGTAIPAGMLALAVGARRRR